MANKIVGTIKDPHDIWGRRIPIDMAIVGFLLSGGKTLGEILKFISKNDPKPTKYTKAGILKILGRLGDKIKKHKPRGQRYPTYYITDKILRDISLKGNLFSVDATRNLLDNYNVPSNVELVTYLEEIVKKIGVYTLFNYLLSYKHTSPRTANKTNIERRNAWLEQTIPMGGISWMVERITDRYMPNNKFENYIFDDSEALEFLSEVEKSLNKVFPYEYSICKETFENLDKKVEDHIKYVSEIGELEKWQKECDTKNRMSPRIILKKNECPRCHYDGTFPVPKGSCKGMVFENGFVFENLPEDYTGPEKYWKHCPACGYWGTHEMYNEGLFSKKKRTKTS